MLGYATSAQYAGQVTGPLCGGIVSGAFGMQPVFLLTALMMALCALLVRGVVQERQSA